MGVLRPRTRAWWAAATVLAVAVPGLVIALSGSTGAGDPQASPSPSSTPAGRPNVVLIQSDDQTVEQLEAMPRLQRLLGEAGTTFDRYLVSFPLCCPSRATTLTGQYSHNHGVQGNSPPHGGFGRLRQEETLPVWLSRAGYTTGHVGKFLNGYGSLDPLKVPLGWSEWVSAPYPYQHSYYDYDLNVNGRIVRHGAAPTDHVDDVYTGAAIDFLARTAPGDTPFFLAVDYLAPHRGAPYGTGRRCDRYPKPAAHHEGGFADAPLPRPPSFNEEDVSDKPAAVRERKRLGPQAIAALTENYQCRREALQSVDEGVERIVAELERLGELGNTYVIFISDNAFFQGEHRIGQGKQRVYGADARVPLLIRGPGVPAGLRLDTLAANIDLAPTLLDMTGARDQVPPTFALDGHSLLPELLGRLTADPAAGPDRAILLENGPEIEGIPQFDAVRTRRYVYVEYVTGERELYDLELDPHELDSRHDDPAYSDVVGTLAPVLTELRSCVGPGCEIAVSVESPVLLPPIAHTAAPDRS